MRSSLARFLIGVTGVFILSGAAWADKPSHAGGGKHGKKDEYQQGEPKHGAQYERGGSYRFDNDSRQLIGSYFGEQARAGKCPPGLAKKKNGCMPPGQAKKWAKGRPLPPDLRYNDLPYDLLRRLPPPPPQHRYVQVAGDVLLIAIGTSMVMDAVEDILR